MKFHSLKSGNWTIKQNYTLDHIERKDWLKVQRSVSYVETYVPAYLMYLPNYLRLTFASLIVVINLLNRKYLISLSRVFSYMCM